MCHSFIPGMRNHSAAHAVSDTLHFLQDKLCLQNTYDIASFHSLVAIFDYAAKLSLCLMSHLRLSFFFLRTVQQEPTCLCSPGILWHQHTSSGRPVMPVTAE